MRFNPFINIFQVYRGAFSGIPLRVWIMSGVVLVNRSGTMVLFFLSLYGTQELGFSVTAAANLVGVYGLGSIAGSYLGGIMTDRFDHIRVMIFSLMASAICWIALAFVRDYYLLLGGLFISAAVTDAFRPANSSAVGIFCPPEKRTRCYGLLRLAINLGMTIGPAVGGFLARYDYSLLFWVDGLTCLTAGIILLALERRGVFAGTSEIASGGEAIVSPWRDYHYLFFLVLMLGLGLVFAQVFTTWPLYLNEINGFTEDRIGLLLGLNAALIVLFEMPVIHLLERHRIIRVMMLGTVLFVVGFSILPLSELYLFSAFTVVLWTFGEILVFPLATSYISTLAGNRSIGRYMGLYSTTFALAIVIGPPLGGAIYANLGPNIVWYILGGLGALVLVGLAGLKARR